jgi:hypothetical protein
MEKTIQNLKIVYLQHGITYSIINGIEYRLSRVGEGLAL